MGNSRSPEESKPGTDPARLGARKTKLRQRYERVVRDDDDCAIGHYNLGSALHARRDLEAAAAHFARTIALEPTYADAHFNLGIVHQELGQLADALRCYDAARPPAPFLEPSPETRPQAAKLDEKLADAANAADFIRKNFEDPANGGGNGGAAPTPPAH